MDSDISLDVLYLCNFLENYTYESGRPPRAVRSGKSRSWFLQPVGHEITYKGLKETLLLASQCRSRR